MWHLFVYLFIVTDAHRIKKNYLFTAGPAANAFVISAPFGEALTLDTPLNLWKMFMSSMLLR